MTHSGSKWEVWCRALENNQEGVVVFNGRLAYQVGSGQKVRFWTDKWCGDEPLCESFLYLFSISLSKDAWVLDVWNPDGDEDGWTPFFSRALND